MNGQEGKDRFSTIVLPTRPQPDTLVAIFLLRTLGSEKYPGVRNAKIEFWQVLPPGENEAALTARGIILIDIGGGTFDHHVSTSKTATAELVANELGIRDDPAITKLIEYARRDDFYGKGTVSNDPLDRAFGLSALVANLNRSYVNEPEKVVKYVMPILDAHYREEVRRTHELPAEFENLRQQGGIDTFEVRQRDKKLRAVILTSESASMAGFLRSQNGGQFDVVAQWLPSGHVNILTRPAKRVDLRSLAVLLRIEETNRSGIVIDQTPENLAQPGRLSEISQWYYDPATNSIQNGGLNPTDIAPTKILHSEFRKILELGLSEQLWRPRS